MQKGHPTFPESIQRSLALQAFLRGLLPERLNHHVRLTAPETIEEALLEAERADAVICGPFRLTPSTTHRVRATGAEGEDSEDDSSHQACAAQPFDRCLRCQDQGHLVCYRPPTKNNSYELLETACNECNDLKKYELILLGDFNTNVRNALVDFLTNFNRLFGLKQLISEPTRSCPTSESTINLIMVSDHEKISQSGIIDIGLSDHTVIYCTRKLTEVPLTSGVVSYGLPRLEPRMYFL